MIEKGKLVNLPHGFVGGFNGKHWEIWESIEDYDRGFYPYEGVYDPKERKAVKILNEEEAKAFAKNQHAWIEHKYSKKTL